MSNKNLNWSLYNLGGKVNPITKKISQIFQTEKGGVAVDLGCGSGSDALFWVKKGWNVFGVDTDISCAIQKKVFLSKEECLRYNLIQESIEKSNLPLSDLTYAFDSLFFCDINSFDTIWEKIYDHLKIGGIFSATLIGNRDHLATQKDDIVILQRNIIINKIEPYYKILNFQEEYQDRLFTNLRTGKHSLAKRHWFSFIVQKK